MKIKKWTIKKIKLAGKRFKLNQSQINRVVMSYRKSKTSTKYTNATKKINNFIRSNKAQKRLNWLRKSPFALSVLSKQLAKMNRTIDKLKKVSKIDKPLQRFYNKIFNQYLLVKEYKAITRQLKQERKNQRQHWVGLAKANINLKKPQMTTYNINRVGSNGIESYLRQYYNDYKTTLGMLVDRAIIEGVLLHLNQNYENGIIYGYITNDNEIFSPV